VPLLQLCGFTRIHLEPGEKHTVLFAITADHMSYADNDGKWVLEPGEFTAWVGGQQPNLKLNTQPANVIEGHFAVQV
jgi:beta-glucosidase